MSSQNKILWTSVLCLCISTCFGLLKNCVPPADWDKDVTTPKCEILTNSTEVKCYGLNEISVPRSGKDAKIKDQIKIVCKANYPLDVDVNGVKLKGFPGIFPVRHAKNVFDSSTFKYKIIIPLYAVNLWSPRWYRIRSLRDPSIKTEFYIYRPGANDASLPTDWGSEKQIATIVKPERKFVVLPCVVSHYTDKVILTKLGTDYKYHDVETDNVTVKYEPKAGFILDTTTTPPPWGLYRCKALNTRTRQTEYYPVTVEAPDNFVAIPEQRDLQIFAGAGLALSCQGKSPIRMNGVFNGLDIPPANFSYSEDPELLQKYKGTFVIPLLQVADSGQIHCTQNDNEHSHTWEFKTYDLAKNDILQFNSDKEYEVSCESKSFTLNLFSAECFNFPQCRSRDEFYSTLTTRQCDLPLFNIVNCGTRCGDNNKICLQSQQIRRSGIFKCEAPELSELLRFVKGWSGKLYPNIDVTLSGIPIEDLLRITIAQGKLYRGDIHTFQCESSSFLSNGEHQWFYRSKNGTLTKPTIKAVRGIHDFATFNDSIWEADILLDDPNVTEIVCLAPKWYSEEWVQVFHQIQLKEPTLPEIDDGQTERKFFIGENGERLICAATGEPTPKLEWKINGKNVTHPFEVLYNADGDLVLEFPTITEALANNEYSCTASSFLGSDTKDFSVEITTKPNITPYIVLGITLLVLLVITLVILYWKLLKAKSAIRNLSDEEVQEFLVGNPKAAETVTEPQELILLLPYNMAFEIERDRLRFDEKDVLGSGAYGIVFRGMLTDYPGEVAIKTVKPYSAVQYFKALLSELKIMIYIGKHDNVVHLIGAYTGNIKERVLYMVVELSPYGNLENYLRHNQRTFQNEVRDDRICFTNNMMQVMYTNLAEVSSGYINTLSTTALISWALQIAEGMLHLANKKVIHADLATRNVLLYDNGIVKITDFGLSRQLYAYTSYMKKEQEPLPWRSMAIESLREMNFSTQSDVWAYGVTLWEIFSLGAVPYPGLSWSVDFVDKLSQGLRLSKPQYATTDIYNLMLQCWHTEPDERPSFKDIRDAFKTIENSGKKNGSK